MAQHLRGTEQSQRGRRGLRIVHAHYDVTDRKHEQHRAQRLQLDKAFTRIANLIVTFFIFF